MSTVSITLTDEQVCHHLKTINEAIAEISEQIDFLVKKRTGLIDLMLVFEKANSEQSVKESDTSKAT